MRLNAILLHGNSSALWILKSVGYQLVTEQLVHLLQSLALGFCERLVSTILGLQANSNLPG